MKDDKNLNVCVLSCFGEGYLVDVTIWNSEVDVQKLQGGWIIFSGFRVKKLTEGKFVLVSSVFSTIKPFKGKPEKFFSFEDFYPNLSNIYEGRSTIGIQHRSQENEKLYS